MAPADEGSVPVTAPDADAKVAEEPKAESSAAAAPAAKEDGGPKVVVGSDAPFSINPVQFFNLIQDKDHDALKAYGGTKGVMATLQSDQTKGIQEGSVHRRLEAYGVNELPPEEEVTFCNYFIEAISDKMMILLLVLGTVALIINMTTPEQGNDEVHYNKAWIDGTFIIVAVMIVILVTSINDYMKGLKFAALNEISSRADAYVIRDGERKKIDISEIVVGDVLEFTGGTFLSCDGLFLEGQNVSFDEAAATGENDEKKKDPEKDPFMMSGTNCLAGVDAKMLVIGVGVSSFAGRLEMEAREKGKRRATPLQEKLDALAELVGYVGIGVAVLLFVTLTLITTIKAGVNDESYDFTNLLDFAIIGVSIIVVAVPEGLPLSVVIALAYSMQAMMEENNMVRSLAACETMGAATSICSDKTGTLTTNEMTQIRANVGGVVTKDYDHNGTAKLSPAELNDGLSAKALMYFVESIVFNTTAERIPAPAGTKNKVVDGQVWLGNKTEQGLLRWAERVLPDGTMELRKSVEKENRLVYPFQSKKKSMTTLVRQEHKYEGRCTMQYTKGAPEILLEYCSHYMDAEGEVHDMTQEYKDRMLACIDDFASDALRTIGVAHRRFGDYDAKFPENDPMDKNLTFVGLSGIEDPVRTEVPGAVRKCQEARVTVRMCTGDNIITAKAIGKKCGIYHEDGLAMEGPKFRRLFCENEEEFMRILPKLQVLARCSPLDKQLLVGNLMLLGEVVAVTGDGTNDAPALKLADVGFAMDDGTQVAKKASKIVLLDNNFVSVVSAVKWGRNVNDNIRKFLQFQFTVNVTLLIITYIGAVNDAFSSDGDGKPPLAAIHLLWANLIMDTMAAMALSTEDPTEALLERPPTYRESPLINRRMWRFILGTSLWQLFIMLGLIFAGGDLPVLETDSREGRGLLTPEAKDDFDQDQEYTLRTTIFNVFIFMQIFNWFHARKLYDEINIFEGFGRSKFFLPIVVFTCGFQVMMVELAQEFMETENQSWQRWLLAILLALTIFPYGLILRFVKIEEKPHVQTRLDDGIDIEENDDGDEDEDEEYGKHAKLKLVMDVRRQQRELIREAVAGAPAKVPPQPRLREALRNVATRVKVIRALRGPRGDVLARRKSSGFSQGSKHSFDRVSARHSFDRVANEPAH